jgi:hypothetical protein
MDNAQPGSEHRHEPRYHPPSEQVCWKKAGCAEVDMGDLIDVSETGLSFLVQQMDAPHLEPGDEISVTYLGYNGRPTHYTVVWEHAMEQSLAVGCTRLSSTLPVAKMPPTRYKLVLAKLQRQVVHRHKPGDAEVDSVEMGTKPAPLS